MVDATGKAGGPWVAAQTTNIIFVIELRRTTSEKGGDVARLASPRAGHVFPLSSLHFRPLSLLFSLSSHFEGRPLRGRLTSFDARDGQLTRTPTFPLLVIGCGVNFRPWSGGNQNGPCRSGYGWSGSPARWHHANGPRKSDWEASSILSAVRVLAVRIRMVEGRRTAERSVFKGHSTTPSLYQPLTR